MAGFHIFSSKAEKYARFRWDYTPEALRTIGEGANINPTTLLADVGAGTGILTRHFVDAAGWVWAVEPDPAMRAQAACCLRPAPNLALVAGCAEALPFAAGSLDVLVSAQAANWFVPALARAEFRRVLRPGGWLAMLKNRGTDLRLAEATRGIYPPETDTETSMPGLGTPLEYYYEGGSLRTAQFPFTIRQTWAQFLGALDSASFAPDEGNPHYAAYARRARQAFERLSDDGVLTSTGQTELWLGQVCPA